MEREIFVYFCFVTPWQPLQLLIETLLFWEGRGSLVCYIIILNV